MSTFGRVYLYFNLICRRANEIATATKNNKTLFIGKQSIFNYKIYVCLCHSVCNCWLWVSLMKAKLIKSTFNIQKLESIRIYLALFLWSNRIEYNKYKLFWEFESHLVLKASMPYFTSAHGLWCIDQTECIGGTSSLTPTRYDNNLNMLKMWLFASIDWSDNINYYSSLIFLDTLFEFWCNRYPPSVNLKHT